MCQLLFENCAVNLHLVIVLNVIAKKQWRIEHGGQFRQTGYVFALVLLCWKSVLSRAALSRTSTWT
jgi:hypothetical protein